MQELLLRLLNDLDEIGVEHEEIYDTECRERMSTAIWEGFIRTRRDFALANEFGLYAEEANRAVRAALAAYIVDANMKAEELGICDFHARLAAFQDINVKSDKEGNYYDDFFGYWRPETFDSAGNNIEPS